MRKPRHTNLTNVLIGISDECVKMAKNTVVDGSYQIVIKLLEKHEKEIS